MMSRMNGLPDVLWIARYDYEPGWSLAPHRHDFHQMICIIAGQAEAISDGGHRFILKKDLIWHIQPGCEHGLTVGDAEAGLKTLDIKYRVEDESLRRELNGLPSVLAHRHAVSTLEAIRAEGLARRPYYIEQCRALLHQLLLSLMRDHLTEPDAKPGSDTQPRLTEDPVCLALIEAIRDHMAEPLNGDRLSALTGYSPTHLRDRARQSLSTTPGQLLIQMRIERARQFIRYSDWELKRIAVEVGFKSIHHFTRKFTEQVGLSPAAWREQQREGIRRDIYIDASFANRDLTIRE